MLAHNKYHKGSVLVYVLIIVSILSIILMGIVFFVLSQVRFSLNASTRFQALHTAEAGINFYRWYLAHEVDGKTADQVADFWNGVTTTPIGVYAAPPTGPSYNNGVTYDCANDEGEEVNYPNDTNPTGVYRICVDKPSQGTTIAKIYATGWTLKKPNRKRTITMRLRRPAWSEFVLLSNAELDLEDGSGVLTTRGKVHSNKGVRFDQDGQAFHSVSSGVTEYDYYSNGSPYEFGVWTSAVDPDLVFLGGVIFPAPAQQFSSVIVNFGQMFSKAQELGLAEGPGKKMHISLRESGGDTIARICGVQQIDNNTKEIKKYQGVCDSDDDVTLPDFAVVYVNNDIWIDGEIAGGGKLSISAFHNGQGQPRQHTIYINGDIIHDSSSDSVFGIVAENNIEIVEDPLGTSFGVGDANSNGDLDINGALLSQGGKVLRNDGFATMNDDINIYGAIATEQGIDIQNGAFGGNLSLEFDQNLLYNPPPYFPSGNAYVIDEWEEI